MIKPFKTNINRDHKNNIKYLLFKIKIKLTDVTVRLVQLCLQHKAFPPHLTQYILVQGISAVAVPLEGREFSRDLLCLVNVLVIRICNNLKDIFM